MFKNILVDFSVSFPLSRYFRSSSEYPWIISSILRIADATPSSRIKLSNEEYRDAASRRNKRTHKSIRVPSDSLPSSAAPAGK